MSDVVVLHINEYDLNIVQKKVNIRIKFTRWH
jgi:hypothetical protein